MIDGMGLTVEKISSTASKLPAIVIGMPVKTLLKSVQLYLAKRKAPATGNNTNKILPKTPTLLNQYREKAKIDGATPKETKSARESSSFPSSL